VPAAVPGEVLTEAIVAQLQRVLAQGGKVTGAADESLATFTVVAEPSC
jgi:arginine/lysine/ornithine decarboxylase